MSKSTACTLDGRAMFRWAVLTVGGLWGARGGQKGCVMQ